MRHIFLGFSIEEWGSLFLLGSSLIAVLVWAVRQFVVIPIMNVVNRLTEQVQELRTWSQEQLGDINKRNATLDNVIDKHEVRISRHDEQLKTLFERTKKD